LFGKKHDLISEIIGRSYKVNEEHLFKCPSCQHYKNKLSVNYEKNVFKCWVCDYSGTNILNLVKKYGSYSQKNLWLELSGTVDLNEFDTLFDEQTEETPPQRIDLPKEFMTLTSKSPSLAALSALNYLKRRGFTREDILKWKIGYCLDGEYANRIIIPSFDKDGYINYFIARSFTDDWYRYKNPPASRDIVFNDLYVDWASPIVLTEGIFDAMKAGNAIPLLGSSLNERSNLFQRIVTNNPVVYLALDSDAERKSLKLIKNLLQYDVKVRKIDIHPFADVAEMTAEEFEQRKEKASFVEEGDYLLYHALSL
jgi:DNA primase